MKFKNIHLFLLVCLFSINVVAQNGTEKISISLKDTSLKKAMEEIEKVSGYTFFYNATEIDVKEPVSLTANDMELRLAIRQMLEPTKLTFKFQRKQIVLTLKEEEAVKSGKQKTVSGTVLDETGSPAIGATVLVKGTVNGVVTDTDGKYSILVAEGETLEYRYIGYKPTEQQVKTENVVNVALEASNVNLKDVVVVGYGTQKKENVTASINTIKPSDISMPVRSLANTIAGQVAGIISIQRSGEPGNDDAAFWIRGQSSYAGGTSPLVLVDGVPRKMNDIDIDEVETFTVLKDAAATAIYGSEGANGVVLITSKRGRAQKTSISFNTQYSVVTPTRMPELLPSYDYLSMWNEAQWNDAGNPDWSTYNRPYSDEILAKYRSGEDTDLYPNSIWTDLLSKNTYNQRYTLNFRGGSEKAKFFVSGAYFAEDGIFKSNPLEDYSANINLRRYNLRSNVDMDITSTTSLSVDISGQYKTRNNPGNTSDAIFRHIVLFPTHLIPMMWSDGSASVMSTDADGRYNPYNMLNYSGYQKRWDAALQSKVSLTQKLDFITQGLAMKGSFSFDADFSSVAARVMSPDKWYVTGRKEDGSLNKVQYAEGAPLGDFGLTSTTGQKKIYAEAQLTYNRTFAEKHEVSGTLVYNIKETQNQNVVDSNNLTLLPYRKQGVVMRGVYSYDGRYVLDASFGATGSENFAEGHRWGIFPAVGLAWNMHSESFMQNPGLTNLFSKIRWRASYGVTGNDNTGTNRFTYRELLTTSGSSSLGLNPGVNGGATGSINRTYENTFAAPNLSWEIDRKINAGIDLGLFRGRVDITADFFSNRRYNILITRVTIPTATGFRVNPWQNYGIVTNKGFDGSIVLKQNFGDLQLSARGNITYAVNKQVERDEVPQAYPWLAYTGQSINQPKLYIAEGLFQNRDFNIVQKADGSFEYRLKPGIATYTQNVKPGDIKYRDLNGDGAINDMDMSYDNGFYPNNPQIVYGFGLNAQFRGFYSGIFFQGSDRASVNLKANTQYFVPFALGRDQSSARMEATNHWTANNPDNANVLYPRLHSTDFANNSLSSTWWYRNASFLRLKNLEFGYQFNKKHIKKLLLEDLRIYVQGTNVALWDHVKMWDPELENSGARYPICGTWTVGLDIKF
jgi:TonB-linked SusC/RagA family outer membrane protein